MILVTKANEERIDYIAAMKKVQADHGIGLYKQAFQMLRLAFGKTKMHPGDYFTYDLFRPALSAAQKAAYLSYVSNKALNLRLSPIDLATHHRLMADKLLCGYLLQGLGLPVPEIRAVYNAHQRFDVTKSLSCADDILDFITDGKNLPVFGKPVFGSRSLGCTSIVAISADKSELTLGDGRQVSARSLADEIVKHYPKGYLFQEVLEQPDKVQAFVGKTAASLRICTVQTKTGPQALYGAWSLPKKGDLIDYHTTSGVRGVALIDAASGKITRVQKRDGHGGAPVQNSTTTGKPLIGVPVPGWETAKSLVIAAHHLFPDHGLLGWDIVLTTRGPVINEVNSNALHLIYQKAAGRGIMNPDIKPLLDEAQDISDRKSAARNAEGKRRLRPTLKRKI